MPRAPDSPLRAIRQYCLSCMGNAGEVRDCPFSACALYPFRFGHNSIRAQKYKAFLASLPEEERQKRQESYKNLSKHKKQKVNEE